MRMQRSAVLVAGLVIGLAACDDAEGPAYEPTVEDDLAVVSGELVAGDVLAMQGMGMTGFGVPGTLFPQITTATRCHDGDDCPDARHDGRT